MAQHPTLSRLSEKQRNLYRRAMRETLHTWQVNPTTQRLTALEPKDRT